MKGQASARAASRPGPIVSLAGEARREDNQWTASLRGAPTAAAERVPPYQAGIVADLQAGHAPELGIALGYTDCIAATVAGDVLARAWQAPAPPGCDRGARGAPRAQATITVDVSTHAGPTGCAVLARLTQAGGDPSTNPAVDALAQALEREALPLLRVEGPRS